MSQILNRLESRVCYESPFVRINSVEQAQEEIAFLRKAHTLGMFNKMLYENALGGGFLEFITPENVDHFLNQISKDAREMRYLPSSYSVGMNA